MIHTPQCIKSSLVINTLRLRQNCCHFADNIFRCIFLNKNAWISFKISLNFIPKLRINNIPALVQIWLGADQATSHYLNHWWLFLWRIYASIGLNELIIIQFISSEIIDFYDHFYVLRLLIGKNILFFIWPALKRSHNHFNNEQNIWVITISKDGWLETSQVSNKTVDLSIQIRNAVSL